MAGNGDQRMLPLETGAPTRPEQIGPSSVEYSPARSILTCDPKTVKFRCEDPVVLPGLRTTLP
jgi:hypothetical protein